jgi:hypothetical protein
MPMRPGDSAPDFKRLEGLADADPEATLPAMPAFKPESEDLPETHVLQMPMMIPHYSDGTTDVLVKGRAVHRDEDVTEATEPLFPRQTVPSPVEEEPIADDAPTIELPRSPLEAVPPPVVPAAVSIPQPAPVFTTPAPPTPGPVVQTAPEPARGPGGLAFLLLLSYASAVTIGLAYLLITRSADSQQQHQLEDLRDPVDEQGTVRIYQRGAELPPGHALTLAGKQRFGNILVEPLRVTEGPIAFEHYSKNVKKKQPPSPPVYKLWLRLTNLSQDQQIAPLDALLLFKRVVNRAGDPVANTFLTPAGQAEAGPIVFNYPAAQDSEWDMVGQDLGRTLGPGESIETYIPSDSEGLPALADAGELTWRFQLRKGYAPSGRGVTTLVEVNFPASAVAKEDAEPEADPAPKSGRKGEKEKGGKGEVGDKQALRFSSPLPLFPLSPLHRFTTTA